MVSNFSDLGVLVVDDESSVTRLLKMMLTDLGISQVFVARDGRDALKFLGEYSESVNIIICDWNMPRMSGLELLQQVRTADPDTMFLMLTGRNDIDSVKAARDFGVNGYLLKPFSAEQLRKKLTAYNRPNFDPMRA
ncbi:MAG: response regulator [Rhodospirillales bacterium]|nr:response regulator [Rhodospirillales bacterium]